MKPVVATSINKVEKFINFRSHYRQPTQNELLRESTLSGWILVLQMAVATSAVAVVETQPEIPAVANFLQNNRKLYVPTINMTFSVSFDFSGSFCWHSRLSWCIYFGWSAQLQVILHQLAPLSEHELTIWLMQSEIGFVLFSWFNLQPAHHNDNWSLCWVKSNRSPDVNFSAIWQ